MRKIQSGSFPHTRLRRLRQSNWIRQSAQETRLHASDLIYPLFVTDADNNSTIPSLPDVQRHTIKSLIEQTKQARDIGIPIIALFPQTDQTLRADNAQESYNPDNLVCRAIQAVKDAVPEIGIMADVALDPYTTHGHDGVLDNKGQVSNDASTDILIKQSLCQTNAGADILAPSDMMDGRIGAIRTALEQEGYHDTIIMSYAVKYASAFYGPFRDALGSKGILEGNKKTYQMNPANALEALHETAQDIAEGADMIMIKPGLPYLDIIKTVADTFQKPTYGYHVSGEFAMLKAASAQGWLEYEPCLVETLTAFKRAGCNGIVTYGALDAARLLCK